MKRYILLSEKRWHLTLFDHLSEREGEKWTLIDTKNDFSLPHLEQIKLDKIFIPHWSYIIPKEIFQQYECIVFHMTDLPFGRGGSPLQNLIVRRHTETKISAIKVVQELDAGDIYLKSRLSLEGTAEEIFIRASEVILEMIVEILDKKLSPEPQKGIPVVFKRRKPEDGNISKVADINQIYDYIRMLDAEGYPKAFLETEHHKYEFSRASLKADGSIIADVRIIRK